MSCCTWEQNGNMLFANAVFWLRNKKRKKTGETKKKSGTMLKDNCSKKVNVAVNIPYRAFVLW